MLQGSVLPQCVVCFPAWCMSACFWGECHAASSAPQIELRPWKFCLLTLQSLTTAGQSKRRAKTTANATHTADDLLPKGVQMADWCKLKVALQAGHRIMQPVHNSGHGLILHIKRRRLAISSIGFRYELVLPIRPRVHRVINKPHGGEKL
jgi:hypothetical protein